MREHLNRPAEQRVGGRRLAAQPEAAGADPGRALVDLVELVGARPRPGQGEQAA
ncbi:hypothetical protein ACFSTC_40915 [Nonomuraea ferruginea]